MKIEDFMGGDLDEDVFLDALCRLIITETYKDAPFTEGVAFEGRVDGLKRAIVEGRLFFEENADGTGCRLRVRTQ